MSDELNHGRPQMPPEAFEIPEGYRSTDERVAAVLAALAGSPALADAEKLFAELRSANRQVAQYLDRERDEKYYLGR